MYGHLIKKQSRNRGLPHVSSLMTAETSLCSEPDSAYVRGRSRFLVLFSCSFDVDNREVSSLGWWRPVRRDICIRFITQMFHYKSKLDSLRWFCQRRSRTPHFGPGARRGSCPPNSNSAEIFVQCSYPQVSSSCVYSFGSYRVDKHTNKPANKPAHKQIPVKTSSVLRYATTLGNQY